MTAPERCLILDQSLEKYLCHDILFPYYQVFMINDQSLQKYLCHNICFPIGYYLYHDFVYMIIIMIVLGVKKIF